MTPTRSRRACSIRSRCGVRRWDCPRRTPSGTTCRPSATCRCREPVVDLLATAPAGGLASTVADLDDMGSRSWPTRTTPCCPLTRSRRWFSRRSWRTSTAGGWHGGLGFMLFRSGDRVFIGHDGGMPGHITSVVVHRPTKMVGTVLMNSTSSPAPSAFAIALADHVIEHDAAAPDPWTPGEAVAGRAGGRARDVVQRGSRRSRSPYAGRPSSARLDTGTEVTTASFFTKIGPTSTAPRADARPGSPARHPRRERPRHQAQLATYLFTREPTPSASGSDRRPTPATRRYRGGPAATRRRISARPASSGDKVHQLSTHHVAPASAQACGSAGSSWTNSRLLSASTTTS